MQEEEPQSTVVCVLYGTTRVDLDWLPAEVPVVLVHNDRLFPPEAISRARVEHLFAPSNIGFGAAANLGADQVRTARVVFVNPDAELTSDHWAALNMAATDEVLTVPLVEPDGTGTIVVSPYPTPVRLVLGAYRLGRYLRRSGIRGRLIASPGQEWPLVERWVSGGVLSIDAQRFRAVGGFDNGYFLYYEDVDLCERLAVHYPRMTSHVAAVDPAVHRVGGSAITRRDRTRATLERARSAHRYASARRGVPWRLAAIATRVRVGQLAQRRNADILIVRLGRDAAMGEGRRVATWTLLAEAAGFTVDQISLLAACRARVPRPAQLLRVIVGDAVPEALTWSPQRLRRLLTNSGAGAVVFVTSRTFANAPSAGPFPIFDYVDRLGVSYRHRAHIATTLLGRWGYGVLGAAHRRSERRFRPVRGRRVAAGVEDATALGADFVPIVAEPRSAVDHRPDVDVLFLGTLDYPPNLAAVRELARQWPAILTRRPGTTALVAGARPIPEVRELCERWGWVLDGDFDSPEQVYARARVAVAPLEHAAGIQTKVIDAGNHEVAQVVYPAALAGLPRGFPAVVADTSTFAVAVTDLLDDDNRRDRIAADGGEWVREHLAPEAWVTWMRDVIGQADR